MSGLATRVQDAFVGLVQNSLKEPTPYPQINTLLRKGATKAIDKTVGWSVPFAARNSFKVLEARPGFLKAKMPFKGNRNHIGTMYAGAMFTLAELPGGILSGMSFQRKFFPILKELKMEFIKTATTDVTIEISMTQETLKKIEDTAEQEGKCDFELEGSLIDANNVLVAKSFGLYQLRQRK